MRSTVDGLRCSRQSPPCVGTLAWCIFSIALILYVRSFGRPMSFRGVPQHRKEVRTLDRPVAGPGPDAHFTAMPAHALASSPMPPQAPAAMPSPTPMASPMPKSALVPALLPRSMPPPTPAPTPISVWGGGAQTGVGADLDTDVLAGDSASATLHRSVLPPGGHCRFARARFQSLSPGLGSLRPMAAMRPPRACRVRSKARGPRRRIVESASCHTARNTRATVGVAFAAPSHVGAGAFLGARIPSVLHMYVSNGAWRR